MKDNNFCCQHVKNVAIKDHFFASVVQPWIINIFDINLCPSSPKLSGVACIFVNVLFLFLFKWT